MRRAGILAQHTRIAVDTAPLVYFLGGYAPRDGVAEELLTRAATGAVEVIASVVTESELLVGALRAGPDEAALVGQLFDGPIRAIPVSRETARHAAEIRIEHGLRMVDAIVAATAIQERCTALLGNDRSFRRLEGITYLHVDDLVG